MNYNIVASGSDANCTILNDELVIEMGTSFKKIQQYVMKFKLVLLTHAHTDHFKKPTIIRLAMLRPMLRFGCPAWLHNELLDCDIDPHNIDVYSMDSIYTYKGYKVSPFRLSHDVPNCGYKIQFSNGERVIYATDTNSIDVEAKDYDLYLIEANYEDEEIRQRIIDKQSRSEYAYEYNVLKNHLSLKKCNDWLYKNMGSQSQYIYMHQHTRE